MRKRPRYAKLAASESPRWNDDIDPDPNVVAQVAPLLAPLLRFDRLTKQFGEFEAEATRRKKEFLRLGTATLSSLAVALLISVWRLIAAGHMPYVANVVGAVVSLLAIGLVLILALSSHKRRWLLSRYWAERVRHWKFHQLLDGSFITRGCANPAGFHEELERRFDLFLDDRNKGFNPVEAFMNASEAALLAHATPLDPNRAPALDSDLESPPDAAAPSSDLVAEQAFAAFMRWRLAWQANHFGTMRAKLQDADYGFDVASRMLFVFSCATAVLDGECSLFLPGLGEKTLLGLALSAVILSVLGVALRVYRSARCLVEDTERYALSERAIRSFIARYEAAATGSERWKIMEQAETALIEETRDFLRVHMRSEFFM